MTSTNPSPTKSLSKGRRNSELVRYQNRLDIGDLSTEDGELALRAFEVMGERCHVPSAKFMVDPEPALLDMDPGVPVRFWRKTSDEEWGEPWFIGYMETSHPLRFKDYYRPKCRGILGKLNGREFAGHQLGGSAGAVLEEWVNYFCRGIGGLDYHLSRQDGPFPKVLMDRGLMSAVPYLVRQFASFHYEVLEGEDGLEVQLQDEDEPADWDVKAEAIGEDYTGPRTFAGPSKHTLPGGRQVVLKNPQLYAKQTRFHNGVIVKGPELHHMGEAGSYHDLILTVPEMEWDGDNPYSRYAELVLDAVRRPRKGGWLKLSGIDQSQATGPFRNPNDLVRIDSDRRMVAGVYAVQTVKWTWAERRDCILMMSVADGVLPVWVPKVWPGGPNLVARPWAPHSSDLVAHHRGQAGPWGNLQAPPGL